MIVTKFTIQACCGKSSIVFKTDRPIMLADIEKFVQLGFSETKHFTKAGILYVDNMDLIITAPLGSDRLQVKCKVSDCQKKVNDFEVLLQQLG